MNTNVEAEIVEPSNAVALRPDQPVAPASLFGTSDPGLVLQKAAHVATLLKDVVRQQGLISNIKGKEYPKCEAWTLLGTMLGVFPVLCWTKPVEGGWEARVEARTQNGAIVGAAEAQCLRGESNWSNRDDFALRSMAQTRATAKALRMPLGFVMTLGGFEATPSEEMVYERDEAPRNVSGRGKPKNAPQSQPRDKEVASGVTSKEQEQADRATLLKTLRGFLGDDEGKFVAYLQDQQIDGVSVLLPTENLDDVKTELLRRIVNNWRSKTLSKFTDWALSNGLIQPVVNTLVNTVSQPSDNDLDTQDPVEPEQDDLNYEMEDKRPCEIGEVAAVTTKEGASNKGSWKLFRVTINGHSMTTFDRTVGETAQKLWKKNAKAWFKVESKGDSLIEIQPA